MNSKSIKALRKIIMDDIFDHKLALLMLAHLDNIKIDCQLIQDRVTERESLLENRLGKLQTKHEQACDLLRDFSKVVENDRGQDYHLLYQYKDFLEK